MEILVHVSASTTKKDDDRFLAQGFAYGDFVATRTHRAQQVNEASRRFSLISETSIHDRLRSHSEASKSPRQSPITSVSPPSMVSFSVGHPKSSESVTGTTHLRQESEESFLNHQRSSTAYIASSYSDQVRRADGLDPHSGKDEGCDNPPDLPRPTSPAQAPYDMADSTQLMFNTQHAAAAVESQIGTLSSFGFSSYGSSYADVESQRPAKKQRTSDYVLEMSILELEQNSLPPVAPAAFLYEIPTGFSPSHHSGDTISSILPESYGLSKLRQVSPSEPTRNGRASHLPLFNSPGYTSGRSSSQDANARTHYSVNERDAALSVHSHNNGHLQPTLPQTQILSEQAGFTTIDQLPPGSLRSTPVGGSGLQLVSRPTIRSDQPKSHGAGLTQAASPIHIVSPAIPTSVPPLGTVEGSSNPYVQDTQRKLRALPRQVFPPDPEYQWSGGTDFTSLPATSTGRTRPLDSSAAKSTTSRSLTRLTDMQHKFSYIYTKFLRCTKTREIGSYERGYWCFDISHWHADQQLDFLTQLQSCFAHGLLGESVWCDIKWGRDAPSEVWTFCGKDLVRDVWAFLYVLSEKRLKTQTVTWKDWQGRDVVVLLAEPVRGLLPLAETIS